MKLHINLKVPMGCPAEGCDGRDFYIHRSHPFGDSSTEMEVKCNKCGRYFYTDKGVVAASVRSEAEALLEAIRKVK